jgi:predicted metalloprotease
VVVGTVPSVVVGTVVVAVAVVVAVVVVVVPVAVVGTDRALVSGGRSTGASVDFEPPQPAWRTASTGRSRTTAARRGMPAL